MDARELMRASGQWWTLTLQGILAILFGIACVFWPGLTILTFIFLFGLFILITGLISVFNGLFSIGKTAWVLTLVLGLVELGIGVYLLRNPGLSFELLVLLVGSALVVYGVFSIVVALSNKETTAIGKTLSIIGSALAIVAGVVMFFQPEAGGIAFAWIVGLFALAAGPLWIVMSMEVKSFHDDLLTLER